MLEKIYTMPGLPIIAVGVIAVVVAYFVLKK